MKKETKISFRIVFILTALFASNVSSFGQSNINSLKYEVKEFEVTIVSSAYSLAYSVSIILTSKKLDVIFKGGLVGEKDSLLFSRLVDPTDTLKEINDININSLKDFYSNNCISDGSQVTVSIKKNNQTKTIHLSNYFQEDIGKIIYLINSLVPSKYKIPYDKERLKAYERLCNGAK